MTKPSGDVDFKRFLDENMKWPSVYVFKFIVPRAGLAQLTALFKDDRPFLRDSKNGKYVGFTVEREMASSAAVMEIYHHASAIQGLMAL
jgi:hypothetical protein